MAKHRAVRCNLAATCKGGTPALSAEPMSLEGEHIRGRVSKLLCLEIGVEAS